MKFKEYYKAHRPFSYLYIKSMVRIARNMTDVIVTTFVKDKLHILKEKDIARMEPLIEETDKLFVLIENLSPFVDAEQALSKEFRKNRKKSKKK